MLIAATKYIVDCILLSWKTLVPANCCSWLRKIDAKYAFHGAKIHSGLYSPIRENTCISKLLFNAIVNGDLIGMGFVMK